MNDSNVYSILGILAIVATIVSALIILLVFYIRCPYVFPYKEILVNISSKRNPDKLDYIDQYLIDTGNSEIISAVK